jgi:hypothetical protein
MRALEQIAWLAGGVAPARIGWGPGPLTAWRRARHRRLSRRLRLHLLEYPGGSTRFAAPHAFWINRRSRVCSVTVGGRPEEADVVWVFTQDPLPPAARTRLEAELARLPAAVPVLNPLEVYDAYHQPDAFPRLAAAGVRVPRTAFDEDDVGRTPVVYKAVGEQPARKFLAPYRGPVPGFRAFVFEDARGLDGLPRRYRAFYLAGLIHPHNAITGSTWAVSAHCVEQVEHGYRITAHECEQIGRLATAFGLDFFAIDYLRRRSDGLPVFLDVNVYPTIVAAPELNAVRGDRGQWHVWDTPERLRLRAEGEPSVWERFDEVMLRVVGSGGR